MSPFGPFYPPRLQASVNHAERLARILLDEERRMSDARRSAAWLVGRADELERFAEAVADTWRRGRRSAEAAATALDVHLDALHDGLAQRLGITAPACCGADAVTTQVPPRKEGGSGSTGLVESIDRLLMNLEAPAAPGRPARPEINRQPSPGQPGADPRSPPPPGGAR